MSPIRVAIAGSTGSIGTQTLEVIDAENSRVAGSYEVVALAVGSSAAAVIEQARRCSPRLVAVADPAARREVAEALPGVDVVAALADVVEPADVVVNGVVGFAGLAVTIEALRAGKRLALANKESLIAAGPVVQPLRTVPGAELVPVDSEHCALHQCLRSSVADRSRGRPPGAHGEWRTVPGAHRRRVGRRDRRRSPGASHVEHGSEDHRRFEHPDEQGARGDRGPRALRHRRTTTSRWSCIRSR
jgi:hypothetical protein